MNNKYLMALVGLSCWFSQANGAFLCDFEGTAAMPCSPGGIPVTITVVYGSLAVETGATFIPPVAPTEGSQFGYITTGPGGVGPASYVDVTGDGIPELDVSLVQMAFSVAAPVILSFDYDVMTEEITGGNFDPYGILLDGIQVVGGAVGGDNGSYAAQTGFNNVEYIGPNDEQYVDGRLGWQPVNLFVPAGAHVFEFFVADASDDIGDTALMIDNVQVNPAPAPASWMLLLAGVGLLRRQRARAAAH